MRTSYDPGHKYDDPFSCYLDTVVMDGDADDYYYDDSGNWVAFIGRHVIYGDSLGFVGRDKFERSRLRLDPDMARWDWLDANIHDAFSFVYGDDDLTIYTLPARWASALVNGDRSGLDGDDDRMLEEWMARNDYPECVAVYRGDPWFAHSNDAHNMGDEVTQYAFLR